MMHGQKNIKLSVCVL